MIKPTQAQIEAAERLIEAYRRGFEDCQRGYTKEYAALTAAADPAMRDFIKDTPMSEPNDGWAAEMLIEVWRSENANARAAERIR